MNKKRVIISILSALIFVIMLVIILKQSDSLTEATQYLRNARPAILLLLIPNTILMYYAAGRIKYPYLKKYGLNTAELAMMEYEQNFVNTVIPAASLSGLVYVTERLRKYHVKPGYSGGLYVYRYIVSIATNWIGILGAIVILLISGKLHDLPLAPVCFLATLVILMVLAFVGLTLLLTGKIHLRNQRISDYIKDLHDALSLAKSNRRDFIASWLWGMLFTVLEDTPFLIVAWSMGHPELFLPMVIAAAAGIIVGAVIPTPSGIGGFDGAMIYLLGGLGTNIALASAIVVVTRTLILVGTTITGYPFWQRGMVKIGRN